ncbi:perlucin-like protein [Mizuhopecten yessoensis]|uniref:Collectin-12 n=1 Tax=Mizuhopecten yessoensis TaxID=6573 RepID=A0A210PW27_MIZYE|nr:perlucin-like protein [Mizuhopecten yessoensis]OWF40662.1 Collectin-12 [Mizuhopecten yessoensis]
MMHGITALVLCSTIALGLGSECPNEEWKRLRNSCFFFSTHELTWINAKYFCHSMPGVNATLVYILSAEENYFVKERLNTYQYIHFYHIGATDAGHEGVFVWEQKNMPVDNYYTNWWDGEPSSTGDEDCTEISTRNGQWNDIPCSESQRFVCRIEL